MIIVIVVVSSVGLCLIVGGVFGLLACLGRKDKTSIMEQQQEVVTTTATKNPVAPQEQAKSDNDAAVELSQP
jgi:hypothetical protein